MSARGWKRTVGAAVATLVDSAGWSSDPSGLRILMYHSVGGAPIDDPYGIQISEDRFSRHMQVLAASEDFDVVPLSAARQGANGVVITFDDGFRDNLDVAAPILTELGLPFVVFVSTGLLSDSSGHYLDDASLQELSAIEGVEIGSHGVSHRPFTHLSVSELSRELTASRETLEGVVQKSITMLSYPHGALSPGIIRHVEDHGYDLAASSCPGLNGARGRRPLALRRTEIVARDTPHIFDQKLRGAWDWLRFVSRQCGRD